MDVGTLAAGMLMAQSTSRAQTIAAKIIKDNAGSDQAVADLLQASAESLDKLATAAAHLGTNLDVTV